MALTARMVSTGSVGAGELAKFWSAAAGCEVLSTHPAGNEFRVSGRE